METTKKTYRVTLIVLVNPSPKIENSEAQTKTIIFDVLASSENEAITEAENLTSKKYFLLCCNDQNNNI